jgi:hypothetical protein
LQIANAGAGMESVTYASPSGDIAIVPDPTVLERASF